MSIRRKSSRRVAELAHIVASSNIQPRVCDDGDDARAANTKRLLVYRKMPGMASLHESREWPDRTDVYCWYCRLPFDTAPIPLVQSYDNVTGMYDVYGVFCTASCAKQYLIENGSNDARTRLLYQRQMLIDVFGWPVALPVPSAHHWQTLDVFGGSLPVDQWRRTHPDIRITTKHPPFVSTKIVQETELKGQFLIDQSREYQARGDKHAGQSLEEQALDHGTVFDFSKLRRPPPEERIDTEAKLRDAHPYHDCFQDRDPSVFQGLLDSGMVPTEAECRQCEVEYELRRQAIRKPKAKAGVQQAPFVKPIAKPFPNPFDNLSSEQLAALGGQAGQAGSGAKRAAGRGESRQGGAKK